MAENTKKLEEQIQEIKEILALDERLSSQLSEADLQLHKKRLRDALAALSERNVFTPGTLVQWKPGLRNKKKPRYGEPAIVVEVLAQPVFGKTDESGSAYFREPLDLVAGFIDTDGDFVVFHFDSRRFMPVEQ